MARRSMAIATRARRAYHIGLMAQDVEKTAPPDAVVEINGYKAVDYRAATEASPVEPIPRT